MQLTGREQRTRRVKRVSRTPRGNRIERDPIGQGTVIPRSLSLDESYFIPLKGRIKFLRLFNDSEEAITVRITVGGEPFILGDDLDRKVKEGDIVYFTLDDDSPQPTSPVRLLYNYMPYFDRVEG